MRENFDKCLKMLLKHEGGFVNHPKDPGGMTNLGVTKKVYEKWVGRDVTEQEMRDLTVEQVAPIYKKNYWDRCKCDDLPSGADWSVFDWAVNSGTGRASKAVQKICGAEPDGVIGPKTLALLDKIDHELIIEDMYKIRQNFYESLNTFDTFGKGWTRRNKETLETAKEMLDETDE
jgi:lysozyme family protein|tara:strand:- start:529 stop:1053 length:525 start_codon:yes stop_codon:yes gene_type:complete